MATSIDDNAADGIIGKYKVGVFKNDYTSIKWGKKYVTPQIFGKRYWYASGSKSGKKYKKVGHNGESNNIPYYKLDSAKQTTCNDYINNIKKCRKNWIKAIGTGVTTYFASVLLVKISALVALLGHGAAAIAAIITTVTTSYAGYKETISYITDGYCSYCEVQDAYVNVSSL